MGYNNILIYDTLVDYIILHLLIILLIKLIKLIIIIFNLMDMDHIYV